MRERLEEFESILRRESCNQPYSLAVCNATYLCRVGVWVDCNKEYILNAFLGV